MTNWNLMRKIVAGTVLAGFMMLNVAWYARSI